jgi:hypothetical protein
MSPPQAGAHLNFDDAPKQYLPQIPVERQQRLRALLGGQ